MSETDWSTSPEPQEQDTSNFQKLAGLWLKPRKIMRQIVSHEKAIWLFPLLVLMVSSLLLTVITASIEQKTAIPAEVPTDLEYYPEDYQEQYSEVMTQSSGFVQTTLFPIIGKWLGLWSNWLILSVLLMVLLLIIGHPLEWHNVFNIAAWSALPYLLRDGIQSIYLLASQKLISQHGLSGFTAPDSVGVAAFLGILLGFLDIYLIWQALLMLAAYKPATQMSIWKAILILMVIVLIFLALRSVPAFLISRVSSVFSNGMFYF